MKEDELRVAPSEVMSAYSITDIAVPPGTEWETGERVRAAFDVFLLYRDPDATRYLKKNEKGWLVANMEHIEVKKLWEEFAGRYKQLGL